MAMTHPPAETYIRRIRNDNKRAYAWKYLAYLSDPDRDPYGGPSRGLLGFMGAQAVQMELARLLREQVSA